MAEPKYPVTPAIRALRAANVAFEPHLYDYVDHGGTKHAAAELGLDEHAVIKTLVMQNEQKKPLIVLMHGDRGVAVGMLAKAIGAKSVTPCDPAMAQKHTGYLVGGTSPFGTKTQNIPVYVEREILALPRIYINGGKRGFLVSILPDALHTLPSLAEVEVAMPEE